MVYYVCKINIILIIIPNEIESGLYSKLQSTFLRLYLSYEEVFNFTKYAKYMSS